MGDRQRKRPLDNCIRSLRSSPFPLTSDNPTKPKQETVKNSSQGNKRRRTGTINPSNNKSTHEEENKSSSASSQSTGKQSSSFVCTNNHNTSKQYCSNDRPTWHTFLSSHSEPNGLPVNTCTEPQQVPSTDSSDNIISSKTTAVHTTDEDSKESSSLDLISTEKPTNHKNSDQSNNTDIRSTTQPKRSESLEIQASILALESLLKVNPNLKNKDEATKLLNKPQVSEKIANRNNKWEVDEKLGARATLGPVLYSNICLNLKETHPDWTSRAAAIAYIWHRQLSNETRKIYSEMAKRNKQLLNNDQPKSKQVDKSMKGSHVTGTLAGPINKDKKLSMQKSHNGCNTIITTHQSIPPSKILPSQSKSLSSYPEICLEGSSMKINSSGQQLAIKRPVLKSESSLTTKKHTLKSNPTAKEPTVDAKKFMEQPTHMQIEFFRIRARYLRYKKVASCLILNDDISKDMPLNKECMLTGEYGNAKLKGNWDTYANYPLHNDKKHTTAD